MNSEKNRLIEISLIFPAYNEAEGLEKAVCKAMEVLKDISSSYEIIIAEDGSTDGTDRIASNLSKKHSTVRHIHSDQRLGRGLALKNATKSSRGQIIAYSDVDLATDMKYLKNLVESLKEGYDIAIGSRMLPESKVSRTLSRKLASKFYNFMVRKMLGSKIRDHQCGFKAYKREALLKILEDAEATHWFWDTEMLVRASIKGYRIKEIPVEWKSGKETKVHLFRDSLSMGWQILKLWWKLKR
jgi:glycosyltransferase involved in cell wall biosynthesis